MRGMNNSSGAQESTQLIFHGPLYSRVNRLLASGSPMIFSSFTSQWIFLPSSMEIRQR